MDTINISERFVGELYQDVFERAYNSERGGLRHEAFTEVLLERLEEAEIIPPGRVAYADIELANLRGQVHGYAYDPEEGFLMLFYCIDAHSSEPLETVSTVRNVGKDEIDRGFRRLEGLVRAVETGKAESIDIADPAFEAVQLIQECRKHKQAIHLYVLTSGQVSERAISTTRAEKFQREVWDLSQFLRYCAGSGDDRINIDFKNDFGITLPCLSTESRSDLKVVLASVPGRILADIYSAYRLRLLERNVRSFLQFTGKVNKGMRDTILRRPECFLAFNNGLSATASDVDLEQLGSGLARITAVRDFQIVNGGQTTATIAWCGNKDNADLSHISVAMKLTIVPADKVDTLVPEISRYANTQNKVQEADFDANHPWQVEVEKLSRTTWTAPTPESPRGTRWFYERARGQYNNELSALSDANKKRYKRETPAKQKLVKTEVAKYILSWEQEPHIVNRGGQYAFIELMKKIRIEKRSVPDQLQFQQYVALAILFKRGEEAYRALGYQGYRANFVSYAVALLSRDLKQRLPFSYIWEKQALPDLIEDLLIRRLKKVQDRLFPKQLTVSRFSTYLKSSDCWADVVDLSDEIFADESYGRYMEKPEVKKENRGITEVSMVSAVPHQVWLSLSAWGANQGQLPPADRTRVFNLSKILKKGQIPTKAEASKACAILTRAVNIGFGHPDLTAEQTRLIYSNFE